MTSLPAVRYLSKSDVLAAMPDPAEQLQLAERTLRALVHDADLPSKIGVHPRPDGSFGHAMPAWLRGPDDDGGRDLLGIKWVTGFPTDRSSGLPAIHATLLLNDPTTGESQAILDATAITAIRTAAISGVAIRRWAPSVDPGSVTVAIVGAGVQGASHVTTLGYLLPECRLILHDRDGDRAAALAASARADGRFADVGVRDSPAAAISDADVALTMVSFGPHRQSVPAEAFARTSLVVTVDYDMCLPAAVARDAALFLVDELGQFRANRTDTVFAGYPDPTAMIGEWLDTPRPRGRVVVTHLGVGLADVVFGDAIVRAARAAGLGTDLAR